MRTAILSCLLAALFSASSVLVEALDAPAATAPVKLPASRSSLATIPSAEPALELRQVAVDLTASAAASYPPDVTTAWLQTEIAGVATWGEVIYTQTFASIPDQLPTAGVGAIGYGTLKKSKRDLVARETGYAEPIVLVLQHVVVTQYIQPVTEVLVIETFTMLPNMTLNATYPSAGNTTYNATSPNGIGNATASMRNFTLPASLDHLPSRAAGTAV
ncbi:hypothetical protein LTR08_000408 [Meristemomyces frigidus]|nr:hypothetical protein LTR08_000408 [Meristemomyces frigidus]